MTATTMNLVTVFKWLEDSDFFYPWNQINYLKPNVYKQRLNSLSTKHYNIFLVNKEKTNLKKFAPGNINTSFHKT